MESVNILNEIMDYYCQTTATTTIVSSQKQTLKYCTINNNELNKCRDWSRAVDDNYRFQFRLECIEADNKDHCMQLIEIQKAHLVSAEPGEIYIAGRYHSLVPIVYEQYGSGGGSSTNQSNTGYYAVAIVKANSYTYIQQPKDLRNKNACFSGVGQLAGWILPIIKLLEMDLIDTIDCNNIIQNAANFFNESCAPNALIDKNNPIGTNPQKICLLCESKKCSGNDFYANFEGALNCLRNKGDVAFVKHTVVDQLSRIHRTYSKRFQRKESDDSLQRSTNQSNQEKPVTNPNIITMNNQSRQVHSDGELSSDIDERTGSSTMNETNMSSFSRLKRLSMKRLKKLGNVSK